MNTKQTLWASAIAAFGASLCCVGPLVLVMAGIGGAWISMLTQLEPLRPWFAGMTLLLLGFAGHRLYRQPVACKPGQLCAELAVQKRQRFIFWLVTVPLLLLLAFPWYAHLLY
jgi:mercuric ion transport protein